MTLHFSKEDVPHDAICISANRRATAVALAAAGAQVALVGRNPDELEEIFQELGGSASGHHVITANISRENQMTAAYADLSRFWDSLDAVVANTGIKGVWAPLDKLEVSEWDETLGINLRGTFFTTKLALPLLRKNGGSVVVVSSINGTRIFSNSGPTAYACSKEWQVAVAKMIALELAADHSHAEVPPNMARVQSCRICAVEHLMRFFPVLFPPFAVFMIAWGAFLVNFFRPMDVTPHRGFSLFHVVGPARLVSQWIDLGRLRWRSFLRYAVAERGVRGLLARVWVLARIH